MNKTSRYITPQTAANADSPEATQADTEYTTNYTLRPAARPSQDAGVVTRASLVVVLSLTLVGAMRWALNITNANARQISTGLTRLQGQYDVRAQSGQGAAAKRTDKYSMSRSSGSSLHDAASSPSIEPEGR